MGIVRVVKLVSGVTTVTTSAPTPVTDNTVTKSLVGAFHVRTVCGEKTVTILAPQTAVSVTSTGDIVRNVITVSGEDGVKTNAPQIAQDNAIKIMEPVRNANTEHGEAIVKTSATNTAALTATRQTEHALTVPRASMVPSVT